MRRRKPNVNIPAIRLGKTEKRSHANDPLKKPMRAPTKGKRYMKLAASAKESGSIPTGMIVRNPVTLLMPLRMPNKPSHLAYSPSVHVG